MRKLDKILVLFVLVLFALLGCQHIETKHYYPNGQLKSESMKDGAIDWSDNKTIAPHFSGMGL